MITLKRKKKGQWVQGMLKEIIQAKTPKDNIF